MSAPYSPVRAFLRGVRECLPGPYAAGVLVGFLAWVAAIFGPLYWVFS
jgi:hypothetical protein